MLLCYRNDGSHSRVQTVQGGIDPGETAEEAAIREIYEEIGLTAEDYRFVAASEVKYRYDWPTKFLDHLKNTTFIGQEQQFFLIEVKSGVEFRLDTYDQEFESVRWGTPQELVDLAWDQKRPGLRGALTEFGLLTGNA